MYLAIDTSSDMAGLALIQNGQTIAECTWHCGNNHTVELLPHLDHLLKQNGIDIKSIEGIIVARGPGSFNGLRVGLGTAKGLAFSLGVPISGISTLEAAAFQYSGSGLPVCPVFDAGRGEAACAVYQLKEGRWQNLMPESLMTMNELCSKTVTQTLFCGELTADMIELIKQKLGDKAIVPKPLSEQGRVAFLAALGEKRLKAGLCDDVVTLQPIYLRRPHISQPKTRYTRTR